MNYRHAFHAGNFADVFKHALLVRLLKSLHRKDKAFAYLETHAGAGRYDLRAADAQQTGEYRDGIARLWEAPQASTEEYLAIVRSLNPGRALRFYPGSPRIARALLRVQDRMRLAEQSPEECARLGGEFASDRQVHIACVDGYAALTSWLPPPERRGLVLIDPPYEGSGEWERLGDALTKTAKRWASGSYAAWYPLKAGAPVGRFLDGVASSGLRKVLVTELALWPLDTPFRLNGCGMLLINPPWRFDQDVLALLETLKVQLKQQRPATARLEWLVPE